ncbi:MAG: hypothetical protein L0G31_09030 [Kocuria sp.]|nr:hypothetical protein [Kocuria sp.]
MGHALPPRGGDTWGSATDDEAAASVPLYCTVLRSLIGARRVLTFL